MGSIKDRNCIDLTKAEDIKKRWQEYTEELYNKCEVKWALGSITMNKASGGDRIPVELFQVLKDASAFSKSCLNILKFTVHVLLKPGLENFEHYFASM